MIADALMKYLRGITTGIPKLPNGVELLLPYESPEVWQILEVFYRKFYSDEHPRRLILGINPGRFGAGVTGIPFTDAKRLKSHCGIPMDQESYEPSSEFVYQVIDQYGGVNAFYSDYMVSSISPVGFIKNGKNFNYYDDLNFTKQLEPYIAQQMKSLLELPVNRETVICFGEGKNYQILTRLNQYYQWFGTIRPLPHPRYVMQYKRRQLNDYLGKYIKELTHTKVR